MTCENASEDDGTAAADGVADDEEIVQGEDFAARFELPEADFALDYSQWDVEYRDGTTAVYNLAERALA